jgi:circadian clock protein KaiC
MAIERIKTGVGALNGDCKSLDDLLNGGIPRGSIVLLSAGNGAGKTIMALQYVVTGAQAGENSVYFSFDQRRSDLIAQASSFGWDIPSLEAGGSMLLKTFNVLNDSPTAIQAEIVSVLKTFKPVRVSVDSISMYALLMELVENIETLMGFDLDNKNIQINRELLRRLSIIKLFDVLKTHNATSLVTSERVGEPSLDATDNMSEFIADGVITIERVDHNNEYFSFLRIPEMRMTDHDRKKHQLHITSKGMFLGATV